MAGDWIKFELCTLDKPEVCQIADLANIDMDAVVGKLLRVWGWFDQHTENGNAPSVSKRLLDRLVGVSGFCDFMISVGWMHEVSTSDGSVISLPNFDRHNGKTAKNRLLTAKRVANHKAANAKGNGTGNAQTVSDALPREDVEKSKSKEQRAGAAAAPPPHSDQPLPPDEPKTRASRLPTDWTLPSEWLIWAIAERPEFAEAEIRTIAASFADYWHAKSGKDATKLDWQATWRNWVRNQKSTRPRSPLPPNGRHSGFEQHDYFDGLTQREDGSYAI